MRAQAMDHDQAAPADWWPDAAPLEWTAPRQFLLPAILLLVSEQLRSVKRLVKDMEALGFGPIERPAVYLALGQLERDGLVTGWDGPLIAGQARKRYGITNRGSLVLRAWMGVVREERECLDRVLHRYRTGGQADAPAHLEQVWRPRSVPGRRARSGSGVTPTATVRPLGRWPEGTAEERPVRRRFRVVPGR